ncbi:hypothetical protein [Micromonospora sp. NPDC006431]|uniref:hypothetical protein n=1 Tax=Micromonospora sp. NPDC006431 TaxID=3364235 RepID=UPI0036B914F4
MTPHPRDADTARPDHVFVNRRHDPGRYRTVDRNRNPDRHLTLDPDNAPVNRPHDPYCPKGTP